MAIARTGLLFLSLMFGASFTASADAEQLEKLRQLDEQVQSIKQQVLQLDQDFAALQDAELYPAAQQLRVFLTMEVFDFDLSAMELSINGQSLNDHRYTPREVYALRKGGVQELHLGNISPGLHTLQARFEGRFEDDPPDSDSPYEKTVEVSFRKTERPLWLELRIDRSRAGNINVRIFQREASQ